MLAKEGRPTLLGAILICVAWFGVGWFSAIKYYKLEDASSTVLIRDIHKWHLDHKDELFSAGILNEDLYNRLENAE